MAITEFGTNDDQTVKIWSTKLFREALKKTYFKRFMGSDENSIIQRCDELEKDAGDTIKYDLLVQMAGDGVSGDNPLEGFEEQLTFYQDSFFIDQRRLGHAFRRMSQQRTLHDLREKAKMNLSDRWAAIYDEIMIAQLTGVQGTLSSGLANHAGNTLVSLSGDTDHYKTGTGWSDTIFGTDHLEYLVEKAETISPLIRKTRIDGEEYYVALIHTNMVTDLRTAAGSKWLDVTKYAYMGLPANHPVFKGSIGIWNNVIVHSTPRMPITNPGASQYATCLFLGAQAGVVGFANPYTKFDRGMGKGDLQMRWYERERDYGNERGVGTGAVFGIKPCRFNSKRFGMIGFDIKCPAHA